MRVWGKLFKENRLIKDTIAECYVKDMSRTAKVYDCLEQISYDFDLQKPIWLAINKQDFLRTSKCRFTQDSFIETIHFDFLEFQVIEEDY